MISIEIRPATVEDVPGLTEIVRCMVIEMAGYGGYPIDDTPEVWAKVAEQILENINSARHCYLLARCVNSSIDAGMIMARLDELEPIFQSKTSLHISAVFTIPELRGRGIARELIGNVLEWGQRMNADQADLHVLVENPARKLYEKIGFRARELEMNLPLFSKEDQMDSAKATIQTIDEYIATFSAENQKILQELRTVIRAAAPEATERISYQMPTFYLQGNLVHFAAFKNHIGFYPVPSGIEQFREELSVYKQGKGSVQFPIDQPLPLDLITRIVKFRVEENLQKAEVKQRKKLRQL